MLRIITLTKQGLTNTPAMPPNEGAGAPEISREMIAAGEEVIDRAFMSAGLSPSLPVYSVVRDVYIAMRRIADRQQGYSSCCRQGG